MRFENKVALITGAMSGIGQAIACRLAEEGADIAIHDINFENPRAEEGPRTPEMIRQRGRRAETYQVDVSKAQEVRAAIAQTIQDFGRVDILVNNAGTNFYKPPFEFTDGDWELIIGVLLTGTWNYCRYLGPHLVERGGGSIVNIASVSAIQPSYWREPYSAAKGGVMVLTQALALDLAESNIRVNAVAPGPTMTPLARYSIAQGRRGGTTTEMVLALCPMRRWAKPEEVAAAVLFLASDDASFVTGHTLVVDGGMTAGNQVGVPWKPVALEGFDLPWISDRQP